MPSFDRFSGNQDTAAALLQMIAGQRIAQTILLGGPEGIGKATLVRRFATQLLGDAQKIEADDLSLPANAALIADREKWTAEKRSEDPLLFASHPDFVTFAPDGPLRQISIQQVRLLKERAQFKPLRGSRRVFLIDHLDRAGEQAANSLLKLMEEPPAHLVVIATAENLYDLLPTIRSRSVIFHMGRLSDQEMQEFVESRGLTDPESRIALAEGSPGLAISLDLDVYQARRTTLLAMLECAAGLAPFASWVQKSESFGNRKTEKLDLYLKILYSLLRDILLLSQNSGPIRNQDIQPQLTRLAERVSFAWIEQAVKKSDELNQMVRRNIQKVIALDAFVMDLRNQIAPGRA